MKYVFNSIATCSSRIGSIKDIDRLPGLVLETPLVLLYAKGGSVPHLTHEVLQKVTKVQQPLQIPISTVVNCREAIAAFNKGIADFIGLKEYFTFCSIHDPAKPTPHGFNDKDTVSFWPRTGRKQLDPDKYMDIMETFRPDMYQTLCDGDTDVNSSKKRIQKSVDRTSSMFKKCLQRHEKSEVLKKSAVLGVVEGGYCIHARQKSAKEVGTSSVFGCVIDGLHNNGAEVENIPFDQVKPSLRLPLKFLPNEKFRVVQGCWNPEMVLNLVEMGIDAFDSSFPYAVAERGGALVFQNKVHHCSISDHCHQSDVTLGEGCGSNGVNMEHDSDILQTNDSKEPDLKKKRIIENTKDTLVNNGIINTVSQVLQKKHDDKTQSSSANTKYEITLSEDR
ncbi:hypothetical protein L9F63_005687 [Diploptera punctata]|uniref:tRNA-guanine(15) transglycosylase-like domain-containing protein n=1 Tax=Diploptera punctata TaxID=6984 RepID=A0AAD8E5X7_DIPPU|nr:hypothetical protein L9F63_005687 [Diploptera punctata]